MNALFNKREVPGELRAELWKEYNKKLSNAVDQGYKPSIEFYDTDLVNALKENIAVFSAFKEASFNSVLKDLLIDEKKGLRSWDEFKKEATKIDAKYNQQWLKTEYHQTIASANAAQKWKDIQRTKHIYPNLKYVTVNDNRVRDKHRAWHGKILPIDHPFWKVNFPPNDWACRCDAIRTADDPSPEAEIPTSIPNDKFRNNPGESGKVFPETVYANGVSDEDFKKIADWGLAQLKKIKQYAANYQAYRKLKKDTNYFDVAFDKQSGGMKAIHKEHNFDNKTGWTEKEVQNIGFKNGYSVILDKEIMNVYKLRNTEGFWNNLPFEIASTETATENNIRNGLKHCASKKKTRIAILYFPNNNFQYEIFKKGLAKYNGLKADEKQFLKFDRIICISGDKIVYNKSH
ncbi:phage minor head protein [Weeksella virosa]|uniref:Phage head morphogenesis protein, SPP1 gp7 family n=2 Tax=Flavobacteriales TaxID=200644 RepID=F0P2V9_WEEVC|nr:phage minor head protein [Weeksella virosa]ADX66849.1 phage head morphogenesis protein, SPP1 gp7 family [Weeksella virosa DSM 16922]VEH63427.1 phage head morphogenesis protein, SPP1 gp7 family [Weeksella virosa]